MICARPEKFVAGFLLEPVMADELISQHKNMAMGKGILGDETFGTESPFKPAGGTADNRKSLKDNERAISRPRGFHPEPDHGDY